MTEKERINTGLSFVENLEPTKIVQKTWGQELFIENNEAYCGKFLIFNRGKCCSLHKHKVKAEIFLVLQGEFDVVYGTNPKEKLLKKRISTGDTFKVNPDLYHQMHALEQNGSRWPCVLLEISSFDRAEDSYRHSVGY